MDEQAPNTSQSSYDRNRDNWDVTRLYEPWHFINYCVATYSYRMVYREMESLVNHTRVQECKWEIARSVEISNYMYKLQKLSIL